MYFCPDNKLYCKSCKPDAYEHSFETVTVQDMMKYHSSGVGAASGSGDSGGGGGDIDDSTLMEIDSVEEGGKGAEEGGSAASGGGGGGGGGGGAGSGSSSDPARVCDSLLCAVADCATHAHSTHSCSNCGAVVHHLCWCNVAKIFGLTEHDCSRMNSVYCSRKCYKDMKVPLPKDCFLVRPLHDKPHRL